MALSVLEGRHGQLGKLDQNSLVVAFLLGPVTPGSTLHVVVHVLMFHSPHGTYSGLGAT